MWATTVVRGMKAVVALAVGIVALITSLSIVVGSSSYLAIKATMPQNGVIGVDYLNDEASNNSNSMVDDVNRRGRGDGGSGMKSCGNVGEDAPGRNIRWLLENHDRFNYSYAEFDENMSIIWIIEAEDEYTAERLYEHILQMECILESGGTPRRMDPVFWLESQVKEYIETNATLVNSTTVKVIKTGDNECAYETIKLHADVVKGFFERGFNEARETHPIPEEVLELCEPYIGE